MTDYLLLQLMLWSSEPAAVFLIIVAATFVLEDAAAIACGALAARSLVAPDLAIAALLVGTIAGDIALHMAGRLAARSGWVAGLIERRRTRGANASSFARLGLWSVAIARFVPGSRLPAYVLSGVLRLNPLACAAIIAATVAIWTPGLFWIGFAGGSISTYAPAMVLIPAAIAALLAVRFGANASSIRQMTPARR